MRRSLGIAGALTGGMLGSVWLSLSARRRVDTNQALVIHKLSGPPEVHLGDTLVLPLVHRVQVMDLSVVPVRVARTSREGLVCRDNIRANIEMVFFVRVNRTEEDVLRVAQSVGCERASDPEVVCALFAPRFAEAMATVSKQIDFEDLFTKRADFKARVLAIIGGELGGFLLEDAAVERLEQTLVESLDEDNVIDAKGLHKIAELTAERNVRTNALRQHEQKEIARQNLEATEAILEMQRRQADAELKHKREIAAAAAREEAELQRIATRTRGPSPA